MSDSYGRRVSFTKGVNNNFFQNTVKPDQPVAPIKGNLIGRAEERQSTVKLTGTIPKRAYLSPNQGLNRKNEPPKSANWVGYSRPYQTKWNLRGKQYPR